MALAGYSLADIAAAACTGYLRLLPTGRRVAV